MSNPDYINIPGYNHISQEINTTRQKLEDIRSGRLKPIITSSKKETDKIGGLFPSDQLTIAARTGIGKTADVLHRIKDFVDIELNPWYYDFDKQESKLLILYDSWEMAAWRGVLRLYSRAARITVKDILDYETKMQQEAFERLMLLGNTFKNYPIYFRTVSDNVNDWYNSKYKIQEANKDKIIINIADHTRLVTKANERSEEELITNFMKAGMKIKLEMNQINIFLSQMNRAIETSGKREEIGMATPVSSDIFGADSVYQCSDIVIAHHRPGFYGLTTWNGLSTGKTDDPDSQDTLWIECILKQRDGWTGNIVRRHNLAHNEIFDDAPMLTGFQTTMNDIL